MQSLQRTAATLINTQWRLVALGPPGTATPIPDEHILSLEFGADGQAEGLAGCNAFRCSYQIQDATLSFAEMQRTKLACPEEGIMQQEEQYLTALLTAASFESTENELMIRSDDGRSVLRFVPLFPNALFDEWSTATVQRATAPAATAVEASEAAAQARPNFQMPVTCGESWRLSTYAAHNPTTKIDMFRVGGSTKGSAARASAAGRVHELFSPGGVEIDHGNGWFTVYLHMRNIRVRPGQQVALGQQIGDVSDCCKPGMAAHLHYEQLYDRNHDGDVDNGDIVASVIQGKLYNLNPNGPFPVVKSTNCGASAPGWSSWEDLAGTLSSGPAAIARSSNKLDVFATAGNHVLWQRSWTGKAWTEWRAIGGQLNTDPAVASWNDNRIDLFGQGTDRALWHTYSNNGGATYAKWESLGGTLVGAPAAVAWGSERLDVFARGVDNALVHKWFDGERWSDWENLGGTLSSGPAVASWDTGRLDVFVRGSDNGLYHRWHTAGKWSDWEDLGGKLTSDPAAVARTNGTVDVVARGTDNSLWHRAYTGKGWSAWTDLGGVLTSSPALASWGGNRLDAFGRGTDNSLWHIWRT